MLSIPLIPANAGTQIVERPAGPVIWAKPYFNTKNTKDTKSTKKKVSASREALARVQGQDLRVLCALGELRVKIEAPPHPQAKGEDPQASSLMIWVPAFAGMSGHKNVQAVDRKQK
jgi:hypothetical protein